MARDFSTTVSITDRIKSHKNLIKYVDDLNNSINPLVLVNNYKTVYLKSKRDVILVDWAI